MAATRFVIYSRNTTPINTERSLQDNCDALKPIIQRILDRESLDAHKAELLYFSVGRGLWIAFDYDNPEHDDCTVRGFQIRKNFTKISPYFVPTSVVHERIRNCPTFPVFVWHMSLELSALSYACLARQVLMFGCGEAPVRSNQKTGASLSLSLQASHHPNTIVLTESTPSRIACVRGHRYEGRRSANTEKTVHATSPDPRHLAVGVPETSLCEKSATIVLLPRGPAPGESGTSTPTKTPPSTTQLPALLA
ncbi:hypothetical protein B0H67DRAFT_614340 [Lasiosphaeris hirsuta]|uniref:Uncharacterized protein n=1 Tax=Lasiosphaeris hirsuta TaxID=260670 RepID=A0AA40DH77_9PEZI|nr:hypothetical protein B0H67DRAFT_614340 [Lasiosphaeris hirsuta]